MLKTQKLVQNSFIYFFIPGNTFYAWTQYIFFIRTCQCTDTNLCVICAPSPGLNMWGNVHV